MSSQNRSAPWQSTRGRQSALIGRVAKGLVMCCLTERGLVLCCLRIPPAQAPWQSGALSGLCTSVIDLL